MATFLGPNSCAGKSKRRGNRLAPEPAASTNQRDDISTPPWVTTEVTVVFVLSTRITLSRSQVTPTARTMSRRASSRRLRSSSTVFTCILPWRNGRCPLSSAGSRNGCTGYPSSSRPSSTSAAAAGRGRLSELLHQFLSLRPHDPVIHSPTPEPRTTGKASAPRSFALRPGSAQKLRHVIGWLEILDQHLCLAISEHPHLWHIDLRRL